MGRAQLEIGLNNLGLNIHLHTKKKKKQLQNDTYKNFNSITIFNLNLCVTLLEPNPKGALAVPRLCLDKVPESLQFFISVE